MNRKRREVEVEVEVASSCMERMGGACRADDVSGEMMSPQPYVHNFMHVHLTCYALGFAVVRSVTRVWQGR